MTESLVICNKAKECLCFECSHSIPHKKNWTGGLCCTKWGSCFEFPEGQDTAVRCTRI